MSLTRSALSLRNCLPCATFEYGADNTKFVIVKLKDRVKRQHYIVYREQDLPESHRDFIDDVIIVTEMTVFNDKVYQGIKIDSQFPEYKEVAQDLNDQIKSTINLLTEFSK